MNNEGFEMSDELKQLKENYSVLKKELETEKIINDELMKSALKRNFRLLMFDKKLSLAALVVAAVVMPIIAFLFSVPLKFLVIVEIFALVVIVATVVFYRKYDLNKIPFYDVLNASKTMKEFKKSYIQMNIVVWIAAIAIIVSFIPRILKVWSTPLKTVCAVSFLAIVLTVCLFVEFRYSKTIIDSCNSITKSLDEFNE